MNLFRWWLTPSKQQKAEPCWRDDVALLYPEPRATPSQYKELGEWLTNWRNGHPQVLEILGLAEVQNGIAPPVRLRDGPFIFSTDGIVGPAGAPCVVVRSTSGRTFNNIHRLLPDDLACRLVDPQLEAYGH